jgi:hypothetical protein
VIHSIAIENFFSVADTARDLGRQFSLDDLLRAANVDSDLRGLLKKIGLIRGA